MTRVRKKSFLIITFAVPVLFALLCALPTIIMMVGKDKDKRVEVIDESAIVIPYLTSSEAVTYIDKSGFTLDSLKSGLGTEGADAVLYISPLDSAAKNVNVEIYSTQPLGLDLKLDISDKVQKAVEDYRLASHEIENLDEILAEAKAAVPVKTYTLGEDGEESVSSSEVYMGISLVLTMVIYMFIAMFSGMVMTSVIEEKSSKVVEVLVSSVKATELMFGKIIGVACVALTQFFLWIVLAAVLIVGVGSFTGLDALVGDPAQTAELAQMSGMNPAMMESVMAGAFAGEDGGEMAVIFNTLKNVNYVELISAFVLYFLLGYLLYASLFAAIGSAVENEGDSTQLQMPVTIPVLLAFFVAFYAFKAPHSQLAFWGSIIPFTSPIVMLARLPFGVPAWELVLSIVLLLLTFVAFAYISAKIYKIGILMSGKKTTFRDLWKWLKQK